MPGRLITWMLIACLGASGCNGSSGKDAGVDAGDDAGDDAGVDAGGDAGGEWCPADYRGGGWTSGMTLRVEAGAEYCYTFDSTVGAQEQMALKARVLFVPGSYEIPAENGEFDLDVPVCLQFPEPGAEPRIEGAGRVTQDIRTDWFSMSICQPLRDGAGEVFWLSTSLGGGFPPAGDTLVLDERSTDPISGSWSVRLSREGCGSLVERRYFQSCHYSWIDPQFHNVQFEGGEVSLELRIAMVDATMFGLFPRATGVLDGTAFEQADYWKLAFHSVLHFFLCDFIILFDQPIGGACGLKIEKLSTWDDYIDPERKLATIRCDCSEIEQRTIHSVERVLP